MKDQVIELCLGQGQGTLRCVPAVHFRLAFAQRINQFSREWRPDAIAVELGPETAAAGAAWLRELGAGPGGQRVLPCMLGLIKANRRIRASKRSLALHLQETTGKDLRDLPPELLKQQLGFSGVRVLYLSPTDSIIEGMRCALETKTPLYGVDLEETAERQPIETRIQDPTRAWDCVEEYVSGNEHFADSHRDEEIDARRELAMAARLKTLLQRYQRVLFTCGLAHWLQLKALLQNEEIGAGPVTEAAELRPDGFSRTIVHPLLAVHHMDLFPAFAQGYQQTREPANMPLKFQHLLSPAKMFEQLLLDAYKRHFISDDCGRPAVPSHEDWESWPYFEQFLSNLCQVRQLNVADIHTALAAAQGTMSSRFCETLASALMEFPWVSPHTHPNLNVLSPAPTDVGEFIRAEFADAEGNRSKQTFYIDPLPGRSGASYKVRVPIPGDWDQFKPPPIPQSRCGERRTWNPADYLKTAMSARAIDVSLKERDRFRVNPFEGSLLEGLDLKTTMRGYIRGEDRIYVRDVQRNKAKKPSGDGFPVVWIFQTEPIPGSWWNPTGENISNFTIKTSGQAPAPRLEKSRAPAGANVMTGAVDYSTAKTNQHGFTCYRLSGILLFVPPHFSCEQYGIWAETTQYRRNPFLAAQLFSMLRSLYKGNAEPIKIPFDPLDFDWATALILMAIPFAAGRLTVVTPDDFRLPPVVNQHAARYSSVLHHAPLSYFPREQILKMSTDYVVPSLKDGDGNQYPEEVERLMGEKGSANRRLVPRKWLDYGS